MRGATIYVGEGKRLVISTIHYNKSMKFRCEQRYALLISLLAQKLYKLKLTRNIIRDLSELTFILLDKNSDLRGEQEEEESKSSNYIFRS